MPATREQLLGLLWGTAVADALGLPAEGLSPETIKKRWPVRWKQRLLFGRGMTSDDTEHTFLAGQALLESGQDGAKFQKLLAAKVRWWFISLPAGVGLATARACLKLWLGISPSRSGVQSAGNGPAMRAAIIGAVHSDSAIRRAEFVRASSKLTHTDERAIAAAQAIAEAAALIVSGDDNQTELVRRIEPLSERPDWREACRQLKSSLEKNETVAQFAKALGLEGGVTGYALHTMPVALFAAWRHRTDFRVAVGSVLDCGGDTDSVGAIVGGLVGLRVGVDGIPAEWIAGIAEWPRTRTVMEQLAERLCEFKANHVARPVSWFWPGVPFRNAFFLVVVILHGLRRVIFNLFEL